MKSLYHLSVLLVAFALTTLGGCAIKKKAKKTAPQKSKYEQTIEGANHTEGLVTLYQTSKGKLYFSVPDSVLGRDLYFITRISGVSNTNEWVAGQLNARPFLFTFQKDGNFLYMMLPNTSDMVAQTDAIRSSFQRNSIDRVFKAFPIIDRKGQSTLIEVTKLFTADEKLLSPLSQPAMGSAKNKIQASFSAEGSTVLQAKSYPKNVEITSRLVYYTKSQGTPYTVEMHRSILLLPKEPMKPRWHDERMGYFHSYKTIFSSNKDKVETKRLIHRWRLEPSDTLAYQRGELVEPVKPIIFYIDSAFPKKWRATIKKGVEDWNLAFEAAGFKNAIKALDYPADSTFDPNDARYNTIRYATTEIANAMGPSYVDPRSGEILFAQVIWYHNVISLVHSWRFAQTAAVDPRVRTLTFPDEVMNESLRYVTSHEVGHTLGLMHNMQASRSYTIQNLRSPEFTQENGTTPSIMDYARNNFVAQPGDWERGVKLTPPLIGKYDKAAIRWGYALLPETFEGNTQAEEKKLSDLLTEYSKDPMLIYGEQQFPVVVDPTKQTEDLSNDHFESSNLSIANLKRITKNFQNWLLQEGDSYENLQATHKQIYDQYMRHMGHIFPYIGGIEFHHSRQGDATLSYRYTPKAEQQKALRWVVEQLYGAPQWILSPEMVARYDGGNGALQNRFINVVVGNLFRGDRLRRMHEAMLQNPQEAYAPAEYTRDMVKLLFTEHYGAEQSEYERLVESYAIDLMIKNALLTPEAQVANKKMALAEEQCAAFDLFMMQPDIPCSAMLPTDTQEKKENLLHTFSGITTNFSPINRDIVAPYWLDALRAVENIYKRKQNSSNAQARAFYRYQLHRIQSLLNLK